MLNLTLIWLAQKLYPNGRAFRLPEPQETGGYYESDDDALYTTEDGAYGYVTEDGGISNGGILYRLHRALGQVFGQAWTDALSTLDVMFPNRPGFTIDDAREWYKRLGMYDSGTVPLADMKKAIARKLSFPFVPLAKQSASHIQDQLRAAGFDVYVYQNRFLPGPVTRRPGELSGDAFAYAVSGYPTCGQVQCGQIVGGSGNTKVVDYLEEEKDATFDVGDNLRCTFYICGNPIGSRATVPLSRKTEFRQLILKLKAGHAAAYLFIDYI